eukprot:m.336603 g.336603  ORF g.336603 m.336603 type:complete len:135 (-) comp17906_c0_seq1:2101-2505(-)
MNSWLAERESKRKDDTEQSVAKRKHTSEGSFDVDMQDDSQSMQYGGQMGSDAYAMDIDKPNGNSMQTEAQRAYEAAREQAMRDVAEAQALVKIESRRPNDDKWSWRLANLTEEQLERELEKSQREKEFQRQMGF